MALTIADFLKSVNPNIGLVVNLDGSYRIGVEDVNSDEALAALQAIQAAIELIQNPSVITPYTGTGTAIGTLAPGAAYRLLGFRLHMGSALAAGETLTITVDDGVGAAYDVVLYSRDLGTDDVRDVVIEFPKESAYEFNAADEIDIALSANAGGDTYGCKIIYELI